MSKKTSLLQRYMNEPNEVFLHPTHTVTFTPSYLDSQQLKQIARFSLETFYSFISLLMRTRQRPKMPYLWPSAQTSGTNSLRIKYKSQFLIINIIHIIKAISNFFLFIKRILKQETKMFLRLSSLSSLNILWIVKTTKY